jgi:hypothetical protein|tara:strand:- start:1555 stop:2187 length:633 start_codon:yes stop_codon:yes gene_type:complete
MTKKVLAPQDWNHINSSLKNNKITMIDNFFTKEVLSILKIRMLYAKYFDHDYGKDRYQAIDYGKDEDYITNLIETELQENIEMLPEFQRAWSFVYNNESIGTKLHADPSEFNINVWVSDDSVKNSSSNGLCIYEATLPEGMGQDIRYGCFTEKVEEYVSSLGIEPVKIAYKSNRAVIFNGAYFHRSDNVSMKEGKENKRVSYTLLFGSRV